MRSDRNRRVAGIAGLAIAIALASACAERDDVAVDFARERAAAALIGAEFLDRTGVTLQTRGLDCGPAVLHMLLSSASLDVPYDSVLALKPDAGTFWSFADIRRYAAELGLELVGYRANLAALGGLPLPLVAHGTDHFVIVDTIAPDRVVVRDPWTGRIQFTPASFEAWWSGVALVRTRP